MRALFVGLAVFVSSCSCSNPSQGDGGTGGGGMTGGGAGGGSAGGATGGGSELDAGPGTPVIEVPTLGVDFADVDCGSAPADQTVTVKNSGTAPLAFTTSLAGTNPGFFRVRSQGSGTLAPGQTAAIAVNLALEGVRGGNNYGAGLIIRSNDPASPVLQVPLQFKGRGANLSMSEVSLGLLPVGAEQTATGSIVNTGNVAVGVSFGTVAAPFALRYPGSPAALNVPPGVTGASFTVAMTPTQPTWSRAVVPVSYTGVVCDGPRSLALSGAGASGVFTGGADVDFGDTPCGLTAGPRDVTIGNSSSAPFTLTGAALGKGTSSPFVLSGFTANMTVPANGSVTLTLTPRPVPATVDAVPGDFGDLLLLTTSIPQDTEHVVRLTQRAKGALLSWVDGQHDFAQVPPGASSTGTLTLVNLGNAPASVSAAAAPSAFALFGSDLSLEPGERRGLIVTFSPSAAGPATGFVTLNAGTSGLCGPVPAPAPLDGEGLAGTVTVSPSSVFVPADCGSTPSSASITVENTGVGPATVTAQLSTQPSAFDLAFNGASPGPTATTTLAPGRSVYLSVIAKPVGSIAPDQVHETVVISTGNGAPPRVVTLDLQTSGARIEVSQPGPIVQSSAAPAVTTVWVTNRGNRATTLTPAFSRPELSAAPFNLPPGASFGVEVAFDAAAGGAVTGTMTFTSSTPSCELLPVVELTGRKLVTALVLDRSSVDFPRVGCGPPPTPQTVTLSNLGTAAASWAFTSQPQLGPAFEVLPLNGTLAPGQSVQLRVAAVLNVNVANVYGLGQQLDFGEVRSGSTVLPLRLSLSPAAVFLSQSSTAVVFPDTRVTGSSVSRVRFSNRGNVASTLRVATTNPVFRPQQVTVLPGGMTSMPVTFAPTVGGLQTGRVTFSSDTCGSVYPVSVEGTGVTLPKPTVSAPSFDFGVVACQTPNATNTSVTLTNTSAETVTFDAGVVSPRAVELELTPTSGTLTLGQSTVLRLELKTLLDVPPNTLDLGFVQVNTSQGALRLPIDVAPRGAMVGVGNLDPRVPADGGALQVRLSNVGNVGATLTPYFVADGGSAVAHFSPASLALVPMSVGYTALTNTGAAGSGEVRVTVTPPTVPVCLQVPMPVQLE